MRRGVAAGLAIGALTMFASAGCSVDVESGGDSGTFDEQGFPFTFEHPENLERRDDVKVARSVGASADDQFGLMLDEDSGIFIQRVTLRREVDKSNLDEAKREFDRLIAQVDPQAPAGETREIAGFPSLEYRSIEVTEPKEETSRIVVLFEGDQEFALNCQSTREDADEIDAACEQMLDTLARAD